MTRWRWFYPCLSRGAAGFPAAWPGPARTLAAVLLLMVIGGGMAGSSGAAEPPPAKTAKTKAPPAAAVETAASPSSDPVEALRQEMQKKFDEEAKAIAAIRDGLGQLGQDLRVNAKATGELKAKLEEDAILVYEQLSRGLAGAEKLEQLSERLGALESRRTPDRPEAAAPPPADESPNSATALQADGVAAERSDPIRPLIAAVLVFLVLPGVSLLEMAQLETWALPQAGFRNLLVAAVVVLAYFTVGHGLMYGERVFGAPGADAGPAEAFRLYQLALALAASLIVAMILSDRLSLPAYVFLALVFSGLAYPVLGHWVWGGQGLPNPVGWLERRGFQDFAGATVIHSFAAWFALGWIWRFPATRLLGPEEKGADGVSWPNQALIPLGVFLVWLGWFGLALGPRAGTGPPIAPAVLDTLLAGAAALLTALAYLLVPPRDAAAGTVFTRVAGGTVAGLVALSAGVDRVTPVEAIAIGALAGLLHPLAYEGLAAKLLRRDQVAANLVAAHGIGGMFGTLCVGLFGSPGTFMAPSLAQLGNQALGILAALGLGLATGLSGALLCEGFSKLNALRR